MPIFNDLSGQKFYRWTILHRIEKTRPVKCLCKCECGNIRTVFYANIKKGLSKSCGCYKSEVTIIRNKTVKRIKHGKKHHPIYAAWLNLRSRCNYKKHKSFHRYGGRGIKLCEGWEEFIHFYNWSITHGWKEHLTIDRIDNDGNYCPENCQWITKSENSHKKRSKR